MFSITSRLNFTRTLGSMVMLGIMLFLSLPAATYAVDIIIDERDPGASWSDIPGWWVLNTTSAYKGRALGTRYANAWGTFKFGSLQSGKYDVYMYWPNWSGEIPDTAVPVVIKHSAGTQTVTVNQQQNGGQWNRLGSWTLDNTAYLTLTNRGRGLSYFDAVKLVPSSVTPPKDPTLSLTANPAKVGTGGAATLSWASQNTTSCAASAGWSGSKGTSGSETVKNITSSQTYNLTQRGKPPALPGDSPWFDLYYGRCESPISAKRRGFTDERISEFESYEMGLQISVCRRGTGRRLMES